MRTTLGWEKRIENFGKKLAQKNVGNNVVVVLKNFISTSFCSGLMWKIRWGSGNLAH